MKCPNCGSLKYRIEYKVTDDPDVLHILQECQECHSKNEIKNAFVGIDYASSTVTVEDAVGITIGELEPVIKFIKLHDDAKLPSRNNTTDTGFDVYSVEDVIIPAHTSNKVSCGLQVAYITPGYWFETRGRSGLAFKNDVAPFMGTIDNGYRGELGLKLFNFSNTHYHIKKGDRICQIALVKLQNCYMSFVDEIHETERGGSGFGGSGK